MPGKRNLARERAQHALEAPARQHQLHATMVAQLPDRDRALVGQDRILAFLHELGLRRRNGAWLTWRIVLRWRRDHGFPLARGVWHPSALSHPASRSPALSTTFAIVSWTLTRFSTDCHGLFRVVSHPVRVGVEGWRPPDRAA
jgi:hypothetical protein